MGPRRLVRRFDVSSKAESTRPYLSINLTSLPRRTAGPPKVPIGCAKVADQPSSADSAAKMDAERCASAAGRLQDQVATHRSAQLPRHVEAKAAALIG